MGSIKHTPGHPCCGSGGSGSADPGVIFGCFRVPTGFGIGSEIAVDCDDFFTLLAGVGCPCSFYNQTFLVPVTTVGGGGTNAQAQASFESGVCNTGSFNRNWRVTITITLASGCAITVQYAMQYRDGPSGSFTSDGGIAWRTTATSGTDLRTPQTIPFLSQSGVPANCGANSSSTVDVWTP